RTSGGQVFLIRTALLPTTSASVSFTPSTVVGGNAATGQVALRDPAPAGGLAVTLSSDLPAVQVPASVTIPAGAIAATFPVTTVPVAAHTTAAITATAGGTTGTGQLRVRA